MNMIIIMIKTKEKNGTSNRSQYPQRSRRCHIITNITPTWHVTDISYFLVISLVLQSIFLFLNLYFWPTSLWDSMTSCVLQNVSWSMYSINWLYTIYVIDVPAYVIIIILKYIILDVLISETFLEDLRGNMSWWKQLFDW